MKVAVTYKDGEVFQHFGHSEEFKIYEIEDDAIRQSFVINSGGKGHGALSELLSNEDVDVLICGGIGGGARMALDEAGITLYPGVAGNADEAVNDFLNGELEYDPDTVCSHHHGEGGDHGCGEPSCASMKHDEQKHGCPGN